jgi:hypothetical protein
MINDPRYNFPDQAELDAVAEVLTEGRDLLGEALAYYDNVNPTLISETDRITVAALTQAIDFLTNR